MPITLKQLHYFHTLASSRSIGEAAQAVNISQPAMSMQIKALEEEFGAPLVERGRSGIVLTALGAEVEARAGAVLSQTDDILSLAARSRERPTAPVRIGLIPTIAPYVLPKCFPAWRAGFPDIDIAIRESKTATLLADLARNKIDMAVLALPVAAEGLHVRPLFEEPFYVAAGPDFDAHGHRLLTAGDFDDRPLLLLEEGHCLRDQTIQACGINVNAALDLFGATSLATIMEMVANDYGVTLLPEMSLAKEASDPRIQLFAMAEPGPRREVGVVWRETSPYGALYERMADVLIAEETRAQLPASLSAAPKETTRG